MFLYYLAFVHIIHSHNVCTSITVRKAAFVTTDGFSITLLTEDIFADESFIFSSLFSSSMFTRNGSYIRSSRKSLWLLLLLLRGDIETCPGPETMETLFQAGGLKSIIALGKSGGPI